MKLRLIPVVISIAVSSAVLFGGWFAYQAVAMENPFIEQVGNVEGVKDPVVDMERGQATVRFTLEPGASLMNVYQEIMKSAKDRLGDREITVEAEGRGSEALDDWWSKALFDVAQAMETKQYSRIPERLGELAKADGSITVDTEMDDTNVYISIHDGEHSKYVILPRTPATMGVWPNE